MKKILYLAFLFFSFQFLFSQTDTAPVVSETVPLVSDAEIAKAQTESQKELNEFNRRYFDSQVAMSSLSERQKSTLYSITDLAAKARAIRTLTISNEVLELFKITEDRFDGTTFTLSDYAIISTLVLLLVYGVPAFIFIKIFLFFAIKFSNYKHINFLGRTLDTIRLPIFYIISFYALYVSFWRFALHLQILEAYDRIFMVIFLWLITWFILILFDFFSKKAEKAASNKISAREVLTIFRKIVRWSIIGCAILVGLAKWGVDVEKFMLSLGIGGAALAFASKDTIANFFGSLSLIMDTPFKIGDRIQVQGKIDGTVEAIGMRSTRIRNLDNTISILPNSYLANEYIINVSRWKKRKTTLSVGLVYSTTPEQIKKIVADIRRMILEDKAVDPELVMVYFNQFADSSLNINITYFTKSLDGFVHNETIQRINLAIIEIVSKNGSDLAFPTRTLYVQNNTLASPQKS